MPTWWSPLSDGIQRLVGRGRADASTASERSAEPGRDVAPPRPPQAWPWQPPVQRALDPTFQPRLRPDAFAAGLTSHQDPSLRRDLVHEVRPSSGGLVDGLADLVPGQPRTLQRSTELTVRPGRPARPTVQRSSASFLSTRAADELTTVELEPPWAVEAVDAAEPADLALPSPPVVGPPGQATTSVDPPPASVPAAIPRDVRVQRHGAGPAPVAPLMEAPVHPTTTPVAETAPLPVVPVVSRTAAGSPAATGSSPDTDGWVLPVVAMPPTPRPDPPEPPAVRSLPVVTPLVQRRAAPAIPTASTGSSWSDVSSPSTAAEPSASPEPASTPTSADGPPVTAPLSGFAQAIEQLAVQTEADAGPGRPAAVDPVVGPVVPRAGTAAPDHPFVDVQRAVTPDAPAPAPALTVERAEVSSSGGVPEPVVEQPVVEQPVVAPLVGSAAGVAPVGERPVEGPARQRAADLELAELPVVPVAEHGRGAHGSRDVPQLPVVARTPSSAPVNAAASPSPSSSGSAPYESSRTAPVEPLVVARTVPLAGARPVVPRNHLEPALAGGRVSGAAVQPLRYASVSVQRDVPSSHAAAVVAASAPVAASTSRPSAAPDPFVPGSARELPAVSPGLVGPGLVPLDLGSSAATAPWSTPGAPDGETGSGSDGLTPAYGVTVAADRSVQRLAAPATSSPASTNAASARPTTVRALPFDRMFGGGADGGGPGSSGAAAYEEPGWTTADLPVVTDAPAVVQRAVDTEAITTSAVPAPEPAPAPASEPSAAPAPAVPAPAPTAPAGADLDELARRLFDPISARLKAELWLDRERAGLVADAHL